MITTILFDLDGTLLPMDQDVFVKSYFKELAIKLIPHGYDPKTLTDAIWGGTAAMVKNDGSRLNKDAFWEFFCRIYGEAVRKMNRYLKNFTGSNSRKPPLPAASIRKLQRQSQN